MHSLIFISIMGAACNPVLPTTKGETVSSPTPPVLSASGKEESIDKSSADQDGEEPNSGDDSRVSDGIGVDSEVVNILDADIHASALQLMNDKCQSCHGPDTALGNFGNVLNLDGMVQNLMVVPGNANNSKLYSRSADDSMPPDAPLSSQEIDLIKTWINDAMELVSDEEILPSFIPEGASELEKSALTLLNDRCVSCHNLQSGDTTGGYLREMLDPAQMKIAGLVVPGDAARSPLINSLRSGRMPIKSDGSAGVALTPTEVTILENYVNGLAIEPQKLPTTDALRPLEPTYSSVRENIISSRCTLCHGGSRGVAEGVSYTTYAQTLQSIRGENSFLSECTSGSMPEVYNPLNNSELQILGEWMNLGAPQN